MSDLKSTLSARGSRYGPFAGQANLAQILKRVVRNHEAGRGWDRMTSAQREAMDMILHKISRIVNGDPGYDDSWIDIAGYSQLVVEEIKESGVRQQIGEVKK